MYKSLYRNTISKHYIQARGYQTYFFNLLIGVRYYEAKLVANTSHVKKNLEDQPGQASSEDSRSDSEQVRSREKDEDEDKDQDD